MSEKPTTTYWTNGWLEVTVESGRVRSVSYGGQALEQVVERQTALNKAKGMCKHTLDVR